MRKIKGEKMTMGIESSHKDMLSYPTVYFDDKTLPEGKDWKVGKKYRVTLDLEMTGMSMRKNKEGKEHGHYDFNIIGIDTSKKADKEEVNRYNEKD